MSFQILNCWHRYQATVKDAKRKYLTNIILSKCNRPHIHFNTIDIVLNAPQTVSTEPSFEAIFEDKVRNIRAQIPSPVSDPSGSVPCCAVFHQFEPVTIIPLFEIVGHLKPSGSSTDVIPPHLFPLCHLFLLYFTAACPQVNGNMR